MPKIPGAPSELSRCLAKEEWEKALTVAQAYPGQAKSWSHRAGFFEGLRDAQVLPLHEATVANAPVHVTRAILQAHPAAVNCQETSYRRLPLHCACRRNAQPAVIRLLLEAHAGACLVPDELGRLPLHYALSNGAEYDICKLLLDCKPAAAKGVDARGWTPLHVACSMGATTPVMELIIKANPGAVLLRTEKGSSAARCLNKVCPNREELKQLLASTKAKMEQQNSSGLKNTYNSTRGGGMKSLPAMPAVEDLILV